jgi:hypothetical protein
MSCGREKWGIKKRERGGKGEASAQFSFSFFPHYVEGTQAKLPSLSQFLTKLLYPISLSLPPSPVSLSLCRNNK